MIRRIIFAIITILGLAVMVAEPLLAANSGALGPVTTADGQQNGAVGNTLQPQGASQSLQNAPVGDNQTAPATSSASLQAGGDLNSAAISNYLSGETVPVTANPSAWTQERILLNLGIIALVGLAAAIAWQIIKRPLAYPKGPAPATEPENFDELVARVIEELDQDPADSAPEPEQVKQDELEAETTEPIAAEQDAAETEAIDPITTENFEITPEATDEPVSSLVESKEFVAPKPSKRHLHKKHRK